jgi:hypothetical protein
VALTLSPVFTTGVGAAAPSANMGIELEGAEVQVDID